MTRYLIAALIVAVVLSTAFALQPNEPNPAAANPVQVLEGYLKASYARDYRTAYTYIAKRDQRVWDRDSYARRNGSLSGFALALARKLAAPMQVWTINRKAASDRVHYEIGYSVPTGDELSSALLEWDEKKLNRLSGSRQQQLMDSIEALGQSSKAVKMNGRESFDLIRENGEWRIFYDWASANKVKLKLVPPRDSGIEARLSSNEFVAKPSAPFEVSFTLTNHNGVPVSVRLIHHVEPRSVENHLEMIACGALAPVALQPGESQEISMAYVLSPGFGAGRKIQLSYELKPEPARPQTIAEPASNLRLNEQIDRRFVKQ